MTRRSCSLSGLCGLSVFWFVIAGGYVTEGRNLYISHASGKDSWSCDQRKPCKTILRAVTLASRGDHIHLDGTNTDREPYTCQSTWSEHPGVYINKSLSLIGYGNPLPQIRCPEGTGLVIYDPVDAEDMNVTLSGLIFKESSITVQDASATIHGCKFDGSKEGVKFIIHNKIVSSLRITDSTFSRNRECISIVVNSTNDPSQDIQVIFNLKNSLFDANVLSDEGTCISFTESPYTNQSVNCNITLENVRFSRNTFSLRGLIFLKMENGIQNTHLQKVTFIDNSPSSGRGDSECIVRSTAVTIFINSSNFTSQNSRPFYVSASNISLKINNSSFVGHRVEGNGGAISLIGTDLCMFNVSNSSFVNTSAAQGGAISIECTNVYSASFQDSNFTGNIATTRNGGGGAVHINAVKASVTLCHSSFINCAALDRGGGIFITDSMSRKRKPSSGLLLNVKGSRFIRCRCSGFGGSLSVFFGNPIQISVNVSYFIFNHAGYGGAIAIFTSFSQHECHTTIKFSTFSNNNANYSGGAIYLSTNNQSVLILQTVTMDSNRAHLYGGAVQVKSFFALKVDQSRFSNNTAGTSVGGAFSVNSEHTCHVTIGRSIFLNNIANAEGGAIAIYGNSQSVGRPGLNTTKEKSIIVILQSVTMESNRAKYYGGAVYVNSVLLLMVNKSLFFNNMLSSFSSGGAIGITNWKSREACHVTIEHSTFSNNNATEGGAIYMLSLNNQSVVILQTVKLESNRAFSGGAVEVQFIFALKVYKSRFLNNTSLGSFGGGAIYVYNTGILEVQKCHFDSNHAVENGRGGALCVESDERLPSTSVLITETTFNNCCSEMGGGVFYLTTKGNVSLEVKRSRFVENYSLKYKGGAIAIYLDPDKPKDPGCIKTSFAQASQIHDTKEFPSWLYKSHLTFEDTIFERNTAVSGGAVHLTNGKTIFRNCSFIDNFASTLGGHIHTETGSTSLIIRASFFRQNIKGLQILETQDITGSFIYAESPGALKVNNTTFETIPYSNTLPLMLVRNGRLIDLGSNDTTTFNCPVGSEMEILNFTDKVITTVNNTACKIKVTTLEFSCSACPGNSYSLQRGSAFGSQIVPGFQCLPCPFGANCSQNIIAEPNFWGYKVQVNPPTLTFTTCPLGYCSPPQETKFPDYNACQGNRSGELCGHCNESYTETLYSTNCRLKHECKDYWFWPVALIYVSIMALYFTFNPPVVPWIKHQILWFKKHEPPNQDNNFDSGYLKILFYFYQAANLLLVSNSTQHIVRTKILEPIVGLFNFQQRFSPSGLICPVPGLMVVSKQLFSASHVFGTLFMIGIFYILRWGVRKFRGQEAPCVAPYIGGILQTMLLGYTSLASVSFSLLRCVPTGLEKRLFYDGNVVCFQWWQYILIAFNCSFFVPFVFVLLWGSFKLYSRNISVGKFLLACCLPLPSLLYWGYIFLFCRAQNTAFEDSAASQASRNSVERVLYDSFKRPEEGSRVSLSWEGVMIGRRLILIVLKAFVSDPMPRLFIMSFFCFLFLQHHSMTQPFRNGISNIVEGISLLFIVLLGMVNMFFASFLSLAVPQNTYFSSWWSAYQILEIVILCFVPAGFCLLVVAAVLSQVCRLSVSVFQIIRHLLWVCMKWHCRKQDDERRPMLA